LILNNCLNVPEWPGNICQEVFQSSKHKSVSFYYHDFDRHGNMPSIKLQCQ